MYYFKVTHVVTGELIDTDWADSEEEAIETVSDLSGIPTAKLTAKRATPGS